MAAMVSVGVNAQTWTGNTVGAGTFYLYNVGADKFLSAGNRSNDYWGTNANLATNSNLDVVLAASSTEGTYTIDTQLSNNGAHYLANTTWCDGDATDWTFRAVEGQTNVYQIINNGQYIMATEGLDDVEMLGDPGSRTTSTYWKLVTKADRIAALSSATETSPLDATFLITAPNFGRNDTRNSTWQGSPSIGGKDNKASCNFNAEKSNTTFDVYQTISDVPSGWYKLYVQGYYRDGNIASAATAYNGGTENLYAKYYINDVNAPLMSIFDDSGKTGNNGSTQDGITGKFPNNRENQMDAFNAGLYENIPLIVNVKDGNIRVGVKAETLTANAWTGFDNFRLEYLGTAEPEVLSYVKLKNSSPFVHSTGWTASVVPNAFDASNACAEFWKQTSATLTQSVTLAEGYYTLCSVAWCRSGKESKLIAGDNEINIADNAPASGGTRGNAKTNFDGGGSINKLTFFAADNSTINIGIKAGNSGDAWTVWRSFELQYHGVAPISVTSRLLAEAVEEAEGLYASLPAAAKAALQAVVNAKNISYSTGREYSDAADAVKAAIATARPFVDPYARFLSVKTNVVALKSQTTKYTDPGTAVSTFDAAVAAQQTAVDEATAAAAVETAIVNLRKAASAFAGNVNIVTGQYLDLTDAMLYNASMRNSGDLSLWTIESNTNADYPKYANNCSEFWQANFNFYQTAYELPNGNYNIEVSAFHRAGTYHTYLYANNDQVLVLPITNGENNTTAAENSFDAGLYVNSIKITLDEATDVQIGFKNLDGTTGDGFDYSSDNTDKWTIFRDFKIKYFGNDALAVYREEYESALAAATEALSDATYTNVGGADRSNLSTAVTTTYPTSVVEEDETQAKFETATSALTALTTTFKNGVSSWNTFVTTRTAAASYKTDYAYASSTKLAAFQAALTIADDATASVAATQAAAITSTYRLYVESNALAEGVDGAVNVTSLITNPDANDGANNWSGDFGTLSAQAFTQGDGTTGGAYFDKNGASSYTAEQTIESLPVGTYLLTVTARAQTGTETYQVKATNAAGTAATEDIAAVGNTGGDFNLGWNDASVVFTQPYDGSATIGITASNSSNFWLSFDRVRLVQLSDVPTGAVAYSFDASEWVAGDAGRISSENVTVDAENNTITVNKTGDNNVNLNYHTSAVKYVGQDNAIFVIKATGISTADGASYLWWMNAKNFDSQIAPSYTWTEDGKTCLAWDIVTSGIGGNMNIGTGRTYLNGTSEWTTVFGLTQADAETPVVISYIGYDTSIPVTLDETTDNTIKAVRTADVTLKRTVKVGYNTVVVPFDLTADQVTAIFGAGAVVYGYSETSADASSAELTFNTVSAGTISANTPVLVKATAASTEKEITGVSIVAPETTVAAAGTNFDYVGIYSNTTLADGDYFLATKNDVQKIFQSNGTDTAKPFRAYFQKKTAGDVKAALLIDGVATAIEGINADDAQNAEIYNLAGQRLNNSQFTIHNSQLKRGIYIVGGKKVLVK